MFKERGFIPIIFIIVALIIGLSAVVVINQRNNSQPPKEASNSASLMSTSSSPKLTGSVKPSASVISSSTPKPSSSSTPTPSNSNNQTNPTSTPTPTPTPSGPSSTDGITVLYPNGGEIVNASSPLTIRWSAPDMNKVVLRLLKNGNHVLDISNPNDPYLQKDNTGNYTWTPSSQIGGSWLGGGFRIYIEAYSASAPNTLRGPDQSDGDFTISQ